MTASVTWAHIGGPHRDEADGWASRGRLQQIVAEINEHVGSAADFVFPPGDNANHATPEQYRAITEALAPLRLPYRVIPGDHDFEPGDLGTYEAAFPKETRPEVEVVAGHRCIDLDIVAHGAGGPDFRLTMHHRDRLPEELARAEAEGQVPLVFMHADPGDLAADGEMVARSFADARVAFVDTGHTHYNELLNDGRVVFGATRSTGQIEEGGGRPGFSIVTVHGRVPSWRFKETGGAWPFVQIVAPADLRMVTRPADPQQVPRPGPVEVVAKLFGRPRAPLTLKIDDGPALQTASLAGTAFWRATASLAGTAFWRATASLDAGLHRVSVEAGADRDTIRLLVRPHDDVPRRGVPLAPGHDVQCVGPWPEHGIEGTQLGPNKNGGRP